MSERRRKGPDIYGLVTGGARRLANHYVWVLVVALALAVGSYFVTQRLSFNSDLASLLPDDHPDLQILRRIQAKYASDTGFMVLLSKSYAFATDRSGQIHMHNGRRWKRWSFGRPLYAIWGRSPDEVFAAGAGGLMLRFDGKSWRRVDTGVKQTLRGLWGRSSSDLFAVGDAGTVIRFDGKEWSRFDLPTRKNLHAISGKDDDLFVVGDEGVILRLGPGDPAAAVIEESTRRADLLGVWAAGDGGAFAVGEGGTLLRRDKGKWKAIPSGTRGTLRGIWGARPDHVLAVGDGGTALRFDGKTVHKEDPTSTADLMAISGSVDVDAWVAGSGCAIRRRADRWYEGPGDPPPERTWWWVLTKRFRGTGPKCRAEYTSIWRPTGDLTSAKAVAPGLAALLEQSPLISRVDFKKPIQFFKDRGLLYANVEDLQRLRDRIEENLERETAKGTGLYLDLEEERTEQSKKDLSDLYKKYRDRAKSFGSSEWYVHSDGCSLGLAVYPGKSGSNVDNLRQVRRGIDRIIEKADLAKGDPLLRIDVGGDAVTKIREYDATIYDIFGTIWIPAVGLVLVILLYFRRLFGLLFTVVPMGMAILWTTAATTLLVGTLNFVTGFLFAVLAGLGIDFGFQLYGRYREGRETGLSPGQAMDRVILDTGRATLTSAVTTSFALLTLVICEFKGFSEFGFIAGIGILFALVGFVVVMPALIFLAERLRLLRIPSQSHTNNNGRPFTPRREPFPHPRVILVLSALAAAWGIFGTTRASFEYDTRKLRKARQADEIERRGGYTLGESFTPALMLTESRQELEAAVDALKLQADRLGQRSAVRKVVTILDTVPRRQHEKKAVLKELDRLLHDKRWNLVSDKAKRKLKLDLLREMARAEPFELEDLPRSIRRAFRGPGFGQAWLALVYHRVDMANTKKARVLKEQVGTFEGSRFVNLGNLAPGGAQVFTDGPRAEIRCPPDQPGCPVKLKERLRGLRDGREPIFSRVVDRGQAYREGLAADGGLRGDVLALARPGYLPRAIKGEEMISRSGSFHVSSGELVLVEVVEVLLREGRLALGIAFVAVFFATLLAFRKLSLSLLAFLPLAQGFLWIFGIMYLLQLKLNIFNFVILPALLGIGIDYGVHFVHRYQSEGAGSLGKVMYRLYWVLFFCAVTTIIGFGNVSLAEHPGLKSLGQLAIIGISSIFFAATYTLPAVLFFFERKKR